MFTKDVDTTMPALGGVYDLRRENVEEGIVFLGHSPTILCGTI